MNKCSHYREETPSFDSVSPEGLEITMIPICHKPGIRELGAPSDIALQCGGDPEKCPYKESP